MTGMVLAGFGLVVALVALAAFLKSGAVQWRGVVDEPARLPPRPITPAAAAAARALLHGMPGR